MKTCKNLFNWFTIKKIRAIDIAFVIILLISYIIYFAFFSNFPLDFSHTVNVQDGYITKTDINNNTYIIDNGRTRILKLENNKVTLELQTTNLNGTYLAENIAPLDNGDFYVHGVSWDESGFLLANEKIIKYNSYGQYIDTIFELDYKTEDGINKHQIFDLNVDDGNVEFVKADNLGFEFIRLSDNKEYSVIRKYDFEGAVTFIQDFAVNKNTGEIFLADKRGKILCANETGISTYYVPENPMTTPFSLDVGSDNSVYFSDIYSASINKISPNKFCKEILNRNDLSVGGDFSGNSGLLFVLTVNNVKISYSTVDVISTIYDNSCVYSMSENGQVLINSAQFQQGNSYLITEVIIYVTLGLCAICAIYLVLRLMLVLIFNKLKMKLIYKYEIIIILTTIISAAIILPMLLPIISSNYKDLLADRLQVVSTIASNKLSPENIENIKTPANFMDENYRKLLADLKNVVSNDMPSSEIMGAQLEKYENGVGYAIAFPDLSISSYYPLDKVSASEVAQVYSTKQPLVSDVNNSNGSFIFARTPILNSNNEVVAVINIAKDNSILTQQLINMIIQVIINLALLLITCILILNEIIAFLSQKAMYKKEKLKSSSSSPLPNHLIRLSVFIFRTSFNISTTFLPIYTLMFYSDSLGIPKVLAGTIPLVINSVFTTIAAVLFSMLSRKFKVKYIIIFASLCSLLSNIMLATANSYYFMTIALLLNGLGFGLLDNSKYSYFSQTDTAERQSAIAACNSGGSSGAFCGLIAGAFLATTLSYNQVFWSAVFIDLIVLLMCIYLGNKVLIKTNENNDEKSISTFKFLFSKSVWPYLLLLTVGFGVISGFICYYVPIYCNDNKFDEKQVALLLLIFSLCTTFLSVPLTKSLNRLFKKKSVYLSILLSLFALLIISNFNNLYILVAGIFFMGIAQSFGVNVLMTYFTENKICEKYGKSNTTGVYSLTLGIGGAISSTVFSSIISSGFALNMWIFSGVIFLALLLYIIFFDKKFKNKSVIKQK